jgi:hypothetical protein
VGFDEYLAGVDGLAGADGDERSRHVLDLAGVARLGTQRVARAAAGEFLVTLSVICRKRA